MIKAQIPCPDYSTLKDAALSFCEGRMPADDYHDLIVDLGIVQYAGDLAAVCPVILRGLELFEVHRRFVKLASQVVLCPCVLRNVLVYSFCMWVNKFYCLH